MARADTHDLLAFMAVARERSFTRAAAQLGLSQSALSRKIKAMEEGLGVRLLERTTRSVSPTQAGRRLLSRVGPHMEEIEAELEALSEVGAAPAGSIRISAADHALRTALWPRIDGFAAKHPNIQVEVDVENGFIDIVKQGYDAGVRLGAEVAKDMIAVRIGPDWRMAVVGSPAYFGTRKPPKMPEDLTAHRCINLRLAAYGGFYAWEFEKAGKPMNVRVQGQLAFNGSPEILTAALCGHGLGCIPADIAAPYLKSGALLQVLKDWMPLFEGYHLYYPSRRHSAAFKLFVDAMRYKGK